MNGTMSAPQQPSYSSPSLSYSGPTPTDPSSSPSTSTGRGPNGTPTPGPSFYQNGLNGSGYNGQPVPYGQYQALPSQSQQFNQHQHQNQHHQPYHHQPYYPRNTNNLGRPPYPPQPHQNKSFDQNHGQGQEYPRYPDQNQQQFGYGWGGPGGGYYPGPGGYPPMGVPGPGPATMQNGYGYGQEGYGRQAGMGYGSGGQGQGQGYEQRNGESEIPNPSAPSGETPSDPNQIHPQHLAFNPGRPEYPYQQNGPSGPGAPPYPYFPPNHPYNFGGGIGYPAYPPPPIGYGGYGFGDGYLPPPPPGAMGAGTPNGITGGGGGGGSSAPTKTLNPAAQGFNFVPPNQPPPPSSAPPIPISAPPPAPADPKAPSSQPVFASIRRSSTPRVQPLSNGQPQPQQKFVPPVMVDGEKLKGIGGRRDSGDEYGGLPSVGGEGGLGLTNGDAQSGVINPDVPIQPEANTQPFEVSQSAENGLSELAVEIPVHTKTDPTDPSLPVQTPLSPPQSSAVPVPEIVPQSSQRTEPPQSGSTPPVIPASPTPLQTPSVHEDTYQFFGPTMSGYTSPSMSAHQPSLAQSMAQLVSTSSTPTASGSAPMSTQAKKPKVKVDGPVVFARRPDQKEASGNTYSRRLRRGVPKGTQVEVREVTTVEKEKREEKDEKVRGPRKGKAVWGLGKEMNRSSGRILAFGEISTEDAEAIRKQPPLPPATSTESTSVSPTSTDGPSSASTSTTTPTPHPQPQPQPQPQSRAKPTSWAALVSSKPSSAAPSSLAPSSVASSVTATPSAGPSKLPSPTRSTAFLPPAPSAALQPISTAEPTPPPPPAKRPAFNYAAAAATGAALSPADELVKILSEGLGNRVGSGARQGTIPRGLINTGNMCFINTILQTLAYCPPFTDLLETLGQRLKADLGRKTPLLEAMIIFLREFQPGALSGSGTSTPQPQRGMSRVTSTASVQMGNTRNASGKEAFVPENVYDAMKENKRFDSMRRGFQEDAEEYLGFFLNTLHEELLHLLSRTHTRSPLPNGTAPNTSGGREHSIERPVSPSEETGAAEGWLEVGKKQRTHSVRSNTSRESAITRIFGGTLRSILHTPGSKDSITLEPYQPLQLDISSANSIVDALRYLSTPETVQTYSSAKKENIDATKTIYVETWPQVLMLHLKRFVYDAEEREVVKKGRAVGYGPELIMPNEIISPPKRSSTPVKYRLFGVVYHHGSTAGGGHYTVAVSRQDQNQWIHFDDELVQPVPTEQVVVSQEEVEMGRAGLIGGREKCAYLLFYQRVRA